MNSDVFQAVNAELSRIIQRDIKKALRLFVKESKTKTMDMDAEFLELETMYNKIIKSNFENAKKEIFKEGLKVYSGFEEPKEPDEF